MLQTRIALVQMESKFGDIDHNLQKIEHFTRKASAQKVDIICFPELCLQGYSRDKSGPTAEPIPGPSSNRVTYMAREHGLIIMVGMAENSGTNNPYITHLVAYPDGKISRYRKTHLGSSEKPYFTPGNELTVFNSEKATLGVEICWDLHFPEVTTILSLKGAEIIFAPHASPTIVGDRREIWLKYLTARAYDNAVFLAACNLVGEDGTGHNFCGGMLVIDPKGNIIAESFEQQEGMLVADLNAEVINLIRQGDSPSMRHSFYLAGRRPELYKDLL